MLRSDLHDYNDAYNVAKGVVTVVNTEDLDTVMPMYHLLEYSKNYSKTSGSLWNYYRDELSDETNYHNGRNKNVVNSESFKYKTSIINNRNKEGPKEVGIAVPLKHLSNFWRTLIYH